ncbi:error-prone DNA polymerase [Aeromicrobium senzhongii]|uniref:Error-prone DNA polymerase n=1 Tax=Aeromicrobium senzhongii TaxID=2663859 RepID=A0ABX6SQ67_9ACTN|nr:error-prone DNA polymerase [Aeromicrobium senzhongii]MTB89240.1 DNA polymerase III subunit alpha [Aeromicrobium senzhongii]QNL93498.1 error-prone DNA polymerase [Aeromicrobium senzhongii]
MGWNNPDISWRELEARLSGRWRDPAQPLPDGGDGPAFSRKRPAYETPETPEVPAAVVPYAELHCHSNHSFLDGASHPEELVREAVGLGLSALALTDHDGFSGAARFAEAAQLHGLRTVYGAELSLGLTGPQNGVPDPEGDHLLVLARGVEGYHALASAITEANLAGDEKGRPAYDLADLAERGRDRWVVLTGCRKGWVRREGMSGLRRLVDLFGHDHVVVELTDHGGPGDGPANDALAGWAAELGLPTVATGNVHAARPADTRLAQAFAAVRARRSLAELDGWLAPPPFLRSGAEMAQRFARWPGAVARSVEIADACAFDLRKASPRLPKQDVPPGHTPMSWLRELVRQGADRLYADCRDDAETRLQRELAVIEDKDFAGYFLIVHDIVAFARSRGILCQGRGSAANSAVCYALEITAVDSIKYGLPFERFLSATRDEEPDIDVDFDSDRREEVIQWVYDKYGRRNAAQVCNVISYRPKSAVRDMAKALGYSAGQQDAWSKRIDSWSSVRTENGSGEGAEAIPEPVVRLAEQAMKSPRHLGIHSGGMVLTERPVGEVVPIERARMPGRTVLQWDKDDCAYMGLVKFDLLGLGMLGAIQHTFDIIDESIGERWTLATIPKEEQGVYDMLCRADSIGVFQVESRAQVGTLPRLRPRRFYELVIEIALIRPGPIQGGAVHPYIRRKLGEEPITYPHPTLEPVLERTLGVPLFQEQLMQIAMVLGGCTGDEADLLRRAMGSKRGLEKIDRLRDQLYLGMAQKGITGDLADDIYGRIQAFANFGFAESHAISFALLVYASSWLKLHHPAAFLAGLLRAQPMGFYSPQSLVADSRRHGVEVRSPDIVHSGVHADLEPLGDATGPTGRASCAAQEQPPVGEFDPAAEPDHAEHRRDGHHAVRLGLTSVQGIGVADAERIVAARAERPFDDMADVVRRCGLTRAQQEQLATAGAFDGFGLTRRQAIWNAGYTDSQDRLPGTAIVAPPPMLPGMSDVELTLADLESTRISPREHPFAHLRPMLTQQGVLAVGGLIRHEPNRRIRVAGLITHRQRPYTAGGVTFLNLEDETGMLNVVVFDTVWQRHRQVARSSAAVVVTGRLEHQQGAVNLVAEVIERLIDPAVPRGHRSRDFR